MLHKYNFSKCFNGHEIEKVIEVLHPDFDSGLIFVDEFTEVDCSGKIQYRDTVVEVG